MENLKELDDLEMKQIDAGGWYLIVDTACAGFSKYFWNDETGECRDVLGNEC